MQSINLSKLKDRDFPGGPAVKNLPYSAGDVGLIPGCETKIPHSTGKLNLCSIAREKPVHHNKDSLCHN